MISQFRHQRNAAPLGESASAGGYSNQALDLEFIETQVRGATAMRRSFLPQMFVLVVLVILLVAGIFLYRLYHPPLPPAVVISDMGQLKNGVWTEAESSEEHRVGKECRSRWSP